MGIFHLTTAKPAETTNQDTPQTDPNTPMVENAVGTAKKEEETPEKDVKTVTIDGPLSHVFTQALQIAYAKEDTGVMEIMLQAKQRQDEEDRENGEEDADHNGVPDEMEHDGSYIYAIDEKTLDNDALMIGAEALRAAVASKKYNKVILSMESCGSVTSKMQLLHDMSVTMGVKVCYSKAQSINQLK